MALGKEADRRDAESDLEIRPYTLRELAVRFWELARQDKRQFVRASFFVVLSGVFGALPPLFPKFAIDDGILKNNFPLVVLMMGLFVGAHGLNLIAWIMAQKILVPFRERVLFRMRSGGFRHLQRLCMRFHDRYPTGLLLDRMFEQSIGRMGEVAGVLAEISANVLLLLLALGVCLYISLPMTLVALAGTSLYILTAKRMGRRIQERTRQWTTAHNWMSGYILDRLRGTKTIQAYALEEQAAREFDQQVWPVQEKCVSLALEQQMFGFLVGGIGFMLTAAIYISGAWLMIACAGRPLSITLGDLLTFMGYQGLLNMRVMMLSNMYGQIAAARVGFAQYLTIMDTYSSVVERPGAAMPAELRGDVEFRGVEFAYNPNSRALQGMSFAVPAGQKVALVGRSGSGKTTIANLLMRFYDPDAGEILIDGLPVRGLPLREYRALFGIVLQDPYLFDDTIEANLRCVQPEATDGELLQALRLARALDFVETFPEGIRHRVGEGGRSLSGGQRQRIAIARCFLLKPRFLILDEATSALDTESEALVQAALAHLSQGRTTFIIAHRLSTIRDADRILVIDQGRVLEDGTFETLLGRKGLFYELHAIATSTSARQAKLEEAGFA